MGQNEDAAGPAARIELELDGDAIRRTRRHVATYMLRWPGADEEAVADAQLVATELVANAIRHAGLAVVLEIGHDDSHFVVAVCDGSAVLPEPRVPTDGDEGGRGMQLIAALSEEWGVDSLPGGHKRVWARLLRP